MSDQSLLRELRTDAEEVKRFPSDTQNTWAFCDAVIALCDKLLAQEDKNR